MIFRPGWRARYGRWPGPDRSTFDTSRLERAGRRIARAALVLTHFEHGYAT
jgi:hypothetical protein